MKLSKREHEVAELMQKGAKNGLIAKKLDLDPKTISTFVKRIADKIGFKNEDSNSYNTYTLVKRCLNLGILKDDE